MPGQPVPALVVANEGGSREDWTSVPRVIKSSSCGFILTVTWQGIGSRGENERGSHGQTEARGGKEPGAAGSRAASTDSDPGEGRAVHAVSAGPVQAVH